MKKVSTYLFALLVIALSFNADRAYSQDRTDDKAYTPPASIFSLPESRVTSFENSVHLIKTVFEHQSNTLFKQLSNEEDQLGYTHQKFQQYFNNLKVEFATVTLHGKEARITNVSSSYYPVKDDFNPTAKISALQAFTRALSHVGATSYLWDDSLNSLALNNYKKPTGELVIVPAMKHISENNRLAYKFDIYATSPLYRADVYIDAHTGEFIMENKHIHHADVPATGTSLYNGTVSFTADNSAGPYRLRQTTDGNGIQTYDMNNGTNYNSATDIVSGSTFFGGNATGVQAHFGAENTHRYFSQNHGRNSYDNAGTVIRSYVSYSTNYVNAFWNGSVMTYGDGDGVQYGPLVPLDIVGHEITHGVVQFSANLVYSYESGALNESFADIFGESVEEFAQGGSHDWLMGDDIGIGSGGAFRSMSNPNTFSHPDTYNGTHWWTSSGDNGGVHINSGVQNFWFYLLSQGGTGTNDIGQSYSVNALGTTKAAAIAYRNLTVYLSANSQFADARTGAIQAAIDLYGAGSAEEMATTNAWHAVGIGAAYDGGGGGEDTCEGIPEWVSGTSYNAGDRVTYQGNLYEWTGSTWIFIMECPVVTDPCAGVPEWVSGTSYNAGDRVTYLGNLYEWTGTTWIFIQACGETDPCAGVAEWVSGTTYNAGDRVTYLGNLYEWTGTTWILIQACGSGVMGENTSFSSFSPPVTMSEANLLKIYPNPTKGNVVNLAVFGTTPTEYVIYNYIGQVVMTGTFATAIDVSQLEKGLYIVQLNSENGKLVDRFIKN